MPMKEHVAPAARWTAVLIVTLAVAAAFAAPGGAADTRPLMRFPDIHGDTVVFVHAEDIWSVPAAGGVAQRLTIHDGEERAPKFSPDGKLVAFTGQYDGNSDVYVMNVHGGDIRRVTYHPGMDEVVAWHPTKGKIVFRSSRNSGSRWDRLFMIAPDGSGLEELPLHEAAVGSFSPDGSKLAFTRVTTEERTWKRYRGGLAPDLWLFDFATGTERKLTDFPGAGRIPLWVGERIYFSSDRDRTLNLYAYDVPERQGHAGHPPLGLRRAAAVGRHRQDRLRARRPALGRRHRDEPAEADPRDDRRRRPRGAADDDQGRRLRHRRRPLAVRHAGRSSWRAARCSRCRRRTGRPATSPRARARATRTRRGRPTATGSPTSRTPPASTSSTSSTRPARTRRCA